MKKRLVKMFVSGGLALCLLIKPAVGLAAELEATPRGGCGYTTLKNISQPACKYDPGCFVGGKPIDGRPEVYAQTKYYERKCIDNFGNTYFEEWHEDEKFGCC